jgi:hypothetical protein
LANARATSDDETAAAARAGVEGGTHRADTRFAGGGGFILLEEPLEVVIGCAGGSGDEAVARWGLARDEESRRPAGRKQDAGFH